MKIVVTGGAGFIGSHTVNAYIDAGHEVVIVDNLSTGSRDNLNPRAKFYELDICSEEARRLIKDERPEILCHQAAEIDVRTSVDDPVGNITVNVVALVGLLEVGREAGLKKVVFASSGGVIYGEQKVFPATENHATWPVSPYGINKLMAEKYLYYYQMQYGISYVALRYANVYGPRQNPFGEAGVVAIFAKKMLSGDQPVINGDGCQTRDYVYVEDVVSANLLALNDEAGGAYNIGTGIETDVNTIFNLLKQASGSSCEEVHAPAKQGEQLRSSISSALIEKELGWKAAVPLDEGLKRTIAYFIKLHLSS